MFTINVRRLKRPSMEYFGTLRMIASLFHVRRCRIYVRANLCRATQIDIKTGLYVRTMQVLTRQDAAQATFRQASSLEFNPAGE